MSTLQYIDPYSAIGDSLTIINNNFIYLDESLEEINKLLSYNINYSSYINNIFSIYLDAARVINNNKAKWNQAKTLVMANSSKWLMPVSLMYPCLIEDSNYKINTATKETLTLWINKTFPVTAVNSFPNYPENQKAFVAVTYKEYIPAFNFTDETMFLNIQTVEFTVKDCFWKMTDYFVGSDINYGVTPTPTPAYTLSVTPNVTPTPTTTGETSKEVVKRLLPTPTPSSVDFFTMTVLEYRQYTSRGGYMKSTFSCKHGGHFIIRVGDNVYYADNNVPVYINNLDVGVYNVNIYNHNNIHQVSTKISGVLYITDDINTTSFVYESNVVLINNYIKSL